MALANKAINLASTGSIFPSSIDKLKNSSTKARINLRFSTNSSVKVVQSSSAESDTGRWVRKRRPQNVDGDFFVGKYHILMISQKISSLGGAFFFLYNIL